MPEVGVRHAGSQSNVRVCGEMDHPVDACKMGKRCLKIGQVNDLQRDATGVEMIGKELPSAA